MLSMNNINNRTIEMSIKTFADPQHLESYQTLLKAFVQEFTKSYTFHVEESIISIHIKDSLITIKSIIDYIYKHKWDESEEIIALDLPSFQLYINDAYISSYHTNLIEKNLEEELNITNHILEQLVEQYDTLDAYLEKAGLYYYEDTMRALINVVSESTGADLSRINEIIFPKKQ